MSTIGLGDNTVYLSRADDIELCKLWTIEQMTLLIHYLTKQLIIWDDKIYINKITKCENGFQFKPFLSKDKFLKIITFTCVNGGLIVINLYLNMDFFINSAIFAKQFTLSDREKTTGYRGPQF